MLDHIGIAVSNYEKSKSFYIQALKPLGYILLIEVEGFAGFGSEKSEGFSGFGSEKNEGAIATFWMHQGSHPAVNMHIAFKALGRNAVDQFYAEALKADGKDNGAPGIRKLYHPNYYGAFVLDPDGYNIEAVCHTPH